MRLRGFGIAVAALAATVAAPAQVNLPRWGHITAPCRGCGKEYFFQSSIASAVEPYLGPGADLHLEFPIYNRSLPNRAQIQATLVYDSSFWGAPSGTWQPEAGGGWWLRTSQGQLIETYETDSGACGWSDGDGDDGSGNIYYYDFSLQEPDGSLADAGEVMEADPPSGRHDEGYYWDCPNGDALPMTLGVADGKGYRVVASGSSYDVTGVAYDGYGDNVTDGLTDPNGNSMSASSSALTDALGTAVTVSGSGTPSSPITFTYTGPNSTPETITVLYASLHVTGNFGCYTGWSGYVNVPESIEFPDGSTYTFGYGNSSGFLTSVTEPGGGVINYADWYMGVQCSPFTITNGYAEYNSIDGSSHNWTWDFDSSTSQTTQQDPLGEDTVFTLDGSGNVSEEDDYAGAWNNSFRIRRVKYSGSVFNRTTVTALCSPSDPSDPCGISDTGQLQSSSTVVLGNGGFVASTSSTDWGVGAPPATPLRQTVNTYQAIGNGYVLASSKVEDGSGAEAALTTWSYGASVNPSSETDYYSNSAGLTTNFTWNANGALHTSTAPTGAVTTFGYTCGSGFYPSSVQTPVGTTNSTWDCNGGVMTGATDLNGHSSSATYDPMWRPLTTVNAEGDSTSLTYPSSSNSFLVQESATTAGSSTDDVLTYLDLLGRPIVQQRREGPGSGSFDSVQSTYDLLGRVSTVSMPYPATAVGQAAPGGTKVTTTTYDALSRAVKVVDGGGGEADYAYSQNDVLSTVDAAGGAPAVARQEEFDGLGRLSSVCEVTSGTGTGANWPGGSCGQTYNPGNGYRTVYTRNPLGQITGVTQNAQGGTTETRSYSFDQLGRLTQEINPETKGLAVSYVYDSDSSCGTATQDLGAMVKRVNARGIATCYFHTADGSGRLDHVTYSDSTPAKYFVYATSNPQAVQGYSAQNAVGRLVEAYTAGSATDEVFGYDPMGRPNLAAQKSPSSGGWYSTNAGHFFNGALSAMALQDNNGNLIPGGQVLYSLDGEGRPDYAVDSAETLVSAAAYTPLGLQAVTFGSSDGHTDADSYSYDSSTGRPLGYAFSVKGATDAGTYSWLANGELGGFSVSDAVTGTSDNGFGCSYAHDDMGRLSAANCGSSSNQTFTFDPFGNVCKTAIAGTGFCPTYNTFNQIAGGSYDNDGDLTTDPVAGSANAFDADGHPTTFIGAAVTYDALGRAVEAGGQEFVYGPGGAKLAVMDGQTLVRADIPLPGGAEAVYNASGFAYYRHADMLGSSHLATNYAGGLYSETAFAPYGEPLSEAGTKDRSFTGQKQDIANGSGATDANGQYDFLAREYSPTQSRWWTPDPAGLGAVDPENPQSWSRYAYIDGSPLEMVDPDGLCGVVFGGITQSPESAGGKALIAYAQSIGADVAFGYAGDRLGGPGDVGSILFGSAGSGVGLAALRDAASQPGPLDVITFSGGAQTLLNSLSADPGLASQIDAVTYYSPGTSTAKLFNPGTGRALSVFGQGLADDLATPISRFSSVPSIATDCSHDLPCEIGAVPPLATGGRCTQPKVFTPKGVSPLGGGGGGGANVGGGGWFGVTGSLGDILDLILFPINITVNQIIWPHEK